MAIRSLLTSLFLTGALVSTGVDAWHFDSSCAPYDSFLSQAMQNAFDMAQYGRRGLEDVMAGSGTQQEKDLADNLFGPRNDTKYDDILARFQALHRSPLVVKQTSGWDPANHADNNVVIFCDYSRLKPMTAQNKAAAKTLGIEVTESSLWDSVMNWPLDMGKGQNDQICRDSKFGDKVAFDALTNHMGPPSDILYSSTQLCPWYIQRLARSSKKTLTDIPDFPAFAREGQAISNVTRGFMPIAPNGPNTMNVSIAQNGTVFEHPAQPSGASTLSTSTRRPTDGGSITTPRASTVISPEQFSSTLSALSLSSSSTPAIGPQPRPTLVARDTMNGGPANRTNSQVDVAQTAGETLDLLDITLLHEMTHTRAAVLHPDTEKPTIDIAMSGWDATSRIRLAGSEFNAESFALYGWSCWLNAQGVSVMRNGSIIPWV